MSLDTVSEESNSECNKKSNSNEKGDGPMDTSPSSGRNSQNKAASPRHRSSSKKQRRDRSHSRSPCKRRSRSRDRSRRDRESRNGRDYDKRDDRKRDRYRKSGRRERSRSRSSHTKKRSKKSRRRSSSTSSSENDLSRLKRAGTLQSLLPSQTTVSKKKKKSKRRKHSSSSSSSSERESTASKCCSVAQPTVGSFANGNYMMPQMGIMYPAAQPPPPVLSVGHIPNFIALPPAPPMPPPLALSVPPPPVPKQLTASSLSVQPPSIVPPGPPPLPPCPPPFPPAPPVRTNSTIVSRSSSSVPLPRRPSDRPVVLNKQRRDVDLSEGWGSGFVDKYEIADQVGEGTYGQVYKAKDKLTGSKVALKKVRLENEKEGFPITAVREIKILRQLNHPNVVRLLDIVTDKETVNEMRRSKTNFYLVFEYVDHDLTGLLEAAANKLIPQFTGDQIAAMFKQLLQGLEYCHQKKFLHRDIKCSNILVNNKGELKIADFGLARIYDQEQERMYTNRVITLWYRPPELLLGAEKYGPAIDVWSVGCILAEFFIMKGLFPGQSEPAQLEFISKLCGTPSPENWPDVAELPLYHTIQNRRNYPRALRSYFNSIIPASAIDLLDKMLVLDPKKRPSATDALRHHWIRNLDITRIPKLNLPINQDCHELWSKKQRKIKDRRAPNFQAPALSLPEIVIPLPLAHAGTIIESCHRLIADPTDSASLRAQLFQIDLPVYILQMMFDSLKRVLPRRPIGQGNTLLEKIIMLLDAQKGAY